MRRWKHILRPPASNNPSSYLPPISSRNEFLFIRTWCQVYEAVLATLAAPGSGVQSTSTALHHLRSVAKRVDLYASALSAAQEGLFHRQITAIKCLGYIQDESALPFLEDLLDHEYAYLSLTAFQAMARIDPQHAMHHRPEAVRPDWPLKTYQQIIDEAHGHPKGNKLPHSQLPDTNQQVHLAHARKSWPEILSRLNRRVT